MSSPYSVRHDDQGGDYVSDDFSLCMEKHL